MFNLKRNQIIITVLVFMIAIAAYLNTQQPINDLETTHLAQDGGATQEEIDFFSGYDEQLAEAGATTDTELTSDTLSAEETTSPQPSDSHLSLADANGTESISAVITKKSEADLQDKEVAASKSAEETTSPQPSDSHLSLADANGTESISAVITKKSEADLQDKEVAASKNLDNSFFAEEKLSREQSRAEQVETLTQWVSNDQLDQESKSKAAANLIEIQERIEKENSAEALLKAKGFSEVYVRIDDDTVDVVVNKAELTDSEIAQIEEIVNRKTGYSVGKINITPLNGVAKN